MYVIFQLNVRKKRFFHQWKILFLKTKYMGPQLWNVSDNNTLEVQIQIVVGETFGQNGLELKSNMTIVFVL